MSVTEENQLEIVNKTGNQNNKVQEFSKTLKSKRDISIKGGIEIGKTENKSKTEHKTFLNCLFQFAPERATTRFPEWQNKNWSQQTITKMMIQEGMSNMNLNYLECKRDTSADEEGLRPDISIKTENYQQLLKTKLQEYYINKKLPHPTSLDGDPEVTVASGYVDPVLVLNEKKIEFHEIFQKKKDERNTEIIIEGHPGQGTSTLARKIMDIWSRQQKEYIKNFDLAFLLVGDTQSKNITSAISDIIKQFVVEANKATKQILSDKTISILLVIDEVDELPQEKQEDVLRNLMSYTFSHITKIVTCKAGLKLESDIPCRRIKLCGIDCRKKNTFLKNILPCHRDTQIEDIIKFYTQENRRELQVISPMYLTVLSTISTHIDSLSITEVYKKLYNTIANIRLQKLGKNIEEEVDLFCFSRNPNYLQKTANKFGKRALPKIEKKNLDFVSDSVTRFMYSLGFFQSHQNLYTAHDMTLLELAAASFISTKYRLKKKPKYLNEIISKYFHLEEHSLFFPFLVALLEEDAVDLFSAMNSIAHWIATNGDHLWILLAEYKGKNWKKVIAAVKNLIPPYVQTESKFFQKLPQEIQTKIVRAGIKVGRITVISLTNKRTVNIFKSLSLTKIDVVIKIYPHEKYTLSQLKGIHCKKLVCEFADEFSDEINDKFLCTYFELFSSITAENYELHINGKCLYEELDNCISQGFFDVNKSIYLHAKLTITEEITPIETLIKNDKVKSLELEVNSNLSLCEIINTIANSEELTCLEVKYKDLYPENSIDLTKLTKNGCKKYSKLSFKKCILTCEQESSNCVDFVAIGDQVLENSRVLMNTNPIKLKCQASIMCELSCSWASRLQHLTLQINEFNSNLCDFLKSCHGIHCLVLLFGEDQLGCSKIKYIIQCIEHIGVQHLVVGQTLKNSTTLKTFMKCFNISTVKDLDVHITFDAKDFTTNSLVLESALNALYRNDIETCNIFCHNIAVWRAVMKKNVLCKSVLNVNHHVLEVCDSHCRDLSPNLKYLNCFSIKKSSRFKFILFVYMYPRVKNWIILLLLKLATTFVIEELNV